MLSGMNHMENIACPARWNCAYVPSGSDALTLPHILMRFLVAFRESTGRERMKYDALNPAKASTPLDPSVRTGLPFSGPIDVLGIGIARNTSCAPLRIR